MYETLSNSKLFNGINSAEIIHIFNVIHHQVKTFEPDTIIAYSGSKCNRLYILVQGSVRGEMFDSKGKIIKVEDVFAPDTFAEGFLFAEKSQLLVNVVANDEVKVIVFLKDDFLKLLNSNKKILENFLEILSNRFVTVTHKIRTLNLNTIESKLANYFLQQEKNNKSSKFKMSHTHQQLADYFGVTRPSLSREISRFVKEGIICKDNKMICIVKKQKLLSLLT